MRPAVRPTARPLGPPTETAEELGLTGRWHGFHGHPLYYRAVDLAAAIHDRKNQDYATGADAFSNFREIEAAGISAEDGILTRMSDKWSRLKNLKKKGEAATAVQDESFDDTLLDLANYALILHALREEKRRK